MSVLTTACRSCGSLGHVVRVWRGEHLEAAPAAPFGGGNSPASPDLRALLQGHSLDFQLMADCTTISMWAKLVQLGRARWQPSAMRGTWQYAVAARLKSMGWHLQPDSSWTHQAVPRQCISWVRNLQIDRIKRLLREAWRFERFAAWQASGRLDAVAAANTTFQTARIKKAWQLWNWPCRTYRCSDQPSTTPGQP